MAHGSDVDASAASVKLGSKGNFREMRMTSFRNVTVHNI